MRDVTGRSVFYDRSHLIWACCHALWRQGQEKFSPLRRPIVAFGVGASCRFAVHLIDRQPAGSEIAAWIRSGELVARRTHEPRVPGHHFRQVNLAIEAVELRQIGIARFRLEAIRPNTREVHVLHSKLTADQ